MNMAHDNLNPWLKSALLMAVLSGVLMILGGILIYREIQQRHEQAAERELELVNRLQSQSVRSWRSARLAEAGGMTGDGLLGQAIARWQAAIGADASDADALRDLLRAKLRLLCEQAGYDAAYLLDPAGEPLLAPEGQETKPLPAAEQQALQRAFGLARPAAVEPHEDPAFAFPFFSLIAPLYHDDVPIAAVWLVLDVRKSLYPLIEQWPSARETAESALAMRDGDSVRILTPLRGGKPGSPDFRIPADRPADPMVQAVHGMRGLFTARDYRQHSVIAVASPVAGSPWYLVSKMDTEEALHSLWQEMLRFAMPVLAGLLCVWLVLAYLQHQAWRRERGLKELLERQVRHDPLTQLANRVALDERFELNWHQAQRHRQPLSILMIDVDHFKAYNDHFGHVAGDRCLKQIAGILSAQAQRSTDLVSRYGGEEFVILLPDTPQEEAAQTAKRVCQAVFAAAIPHPFSSFEQRVTVSIGVACLEPGSRGGAEFKHIRKTLLIAADTALYAAKSAGRNRVETREPDVSPGSESTVIPH